MIGSLISKFFGNKSAKDIKRLEPVVIEIYQLYEPLESLSDQEIIYKYQNPEFRRLQQAAFQSLLKLLQTQDPN